MTPQIKETAEQKLLKMIESSPKAGASGVKSDSQPAFKVNAIALLKVSNKFLIFAILVALIVFFNEARVGAAFSGKDFYVSESGSARDQGQIVTNKMLVIPEVSVYLASMKDRNIFTPFEKGPMKQVVDVSAQNRRIAQKTKAYKLVGVSWLNNVDTASVMLENIEQKKTYFLQKGEKVGDIIVKTIYADSVALGYENEEIIIGYDKTQK